MPFNVNDVNQIAIALVSVSAVTVIIGKIFRSMYKTTRTIELVMHELMPNSGFSLRDAIDRIEARQKEMKISQQELKARLDEIEVMVKTDL